MKQSWEGLSLQGSWAAVSTLGRRHLSSSKWTSGVLTLLPPLWRSEQALPEDEACSSPAAALPYSCTLPVLEDLPAPGQMLAEGTFASWLLCFGCVADLQLWFAKKGREKVVVPMLSASWAVCPLIRSRFPPNVRLSMLQKSNRVSWPCCGVREARGKDRALLPGCSMSHKAGQHPQPGRKAVKHLYTFLLVHLNSYSIPHTLDVHPTRNCAQTSLWEWVISGQGTKSTEQPQRAPLFPSTLTLFCFSSPQSSCPDILHPCRCGRKPILQLTTPLAFLSSHWDRDPKDSQDSV